MNYLAEILAFNNWIRYNSAVNKSDICLWHCLMFMANRFGWKEFNVPILTLLSESKLTKNDFYKSRNKLKQFGLIDFKERGGNKTTVYKVNSIVSLYGTQIGTQMMTQNGTQISTQNGSQSVNLNKTKNQKPKTKNKESIANAIPKKKVVDELFERFWEVYPRKMARQKALDAWRKIPNLEETLDGILAGVEKWIKTEQWRKNCGQFVPLPATFLGQRRWEDEIPEGGKICGNHQEYPAKKLCTDYPE